MKISGAETLYSSQRSALQSGKNRLFQLKEMADSGRPGLSQAFWDELQAASEEQEKLSEYAKYSLACQRAVKEAVSSARQQGQESAKTTEDMCKYVEIARRISNGDHVPPSDEEKLMNYSMEMYSAAKNAAMLADNKDSKEYDSMWDDEEEAADTVMLSDIIDDAECIMAADSYDIDF